MTEAELRTEKQAQRSAASAARRAIGTEEAARKSAAICERIAALAEFRSARNVLMYCPTRFEADISALADIDGIRFAFPVTADGQMKACSPRGNDAWTVGDFGIRQPDVRKSDIFPPELIDAVIVPLVAFDAALMRIGHGGGYYDRFLPLCTKAVLIGAAFEAQRVEKAAAEPHDRRLDIIVTESKVYR